MNDGTHKSTEELLEEAILQVQSASISKQIFHLSHVFVRDPNGYFAVNSVFVVCKDDLAPALHERLDATVAQFFKEHDIVVSDSPFQNQRAEEPETDEKVVPIYGEYKRQDGYVHMRLPRDTSEGLDRIVNWTGLDRDSALEMVLDWYIERLKANNDLGQHTMTDDKPELYRDQEPEAQMAANALLRYRRQANVQGEKEQQDWMARVLDLVRAKELQQ